MVTSRPGPHEPRSTADAAPYGGTTPPVEPGPVLLSAALAAISNAVVVTDADGVILWVNGAFTRMSGYSAAEALGATPRLLKSGVQDQRFYAQLWSTIRSGRSWQGEVVNRHRSGRRYTVRQSITPIVDEAGAATHFVAVHEDVTELRESQARLRALFDHGLDAVVFFDDEGRCVDANPVACELAGRTLLELRSTPISELLPSEDWAVLWPEFRDGARRSGVCRIQRGDTGFADIEVQVTAGVMPGVHVAVCRDVTDMRRAEELRTAILQATSHELRTPLTAVIGFAETLKDHADELDADQRRSLLDRLQGAAARLSQLIADLLDVDGLTSGLVTANRQPHELSALVRRVVDAHELARRRLELDLEAVTAAVDPPKIERVVASLVANAVRHSPPEGTVRVTLHRHDDTAVLAVEDDGVGIDPDWLDAIFDAFIQGPEQRDAPQPGTGIGLTLARELVALHGGHIAAANRPEGGTRLEVTLPVNL